MKAETSARKPWSLGGLLKLRCPRCGADSFRAGLFRTAKACSACSLVFEPEAGFYTGAIYPFYGMAAGLGGLAWGLAAWAGLSFGLGLGAAGLAVALASPWLFWYSRLLFLHTNHRFFGEEV